MTIKKKNDDDEDDSKSEVPIEVERKTKTSTRYTKKVQGRKGKNKFCPTDNKTPDKQQWRDKSLKFKNQVASIKSVVQQECVGQTT